MRFKNLYLVIILLIACIMVPFIILNLSTHAELGSDDRGYVTKDVYSHYGSPTVKIALVTGIHPREAISIVPEQWAADFLLF